MPSGERLYCSIGPVQGFVAQSRRTRDLWASSYLLSLLARAAMDAVVSSGGRIVLPAYSAVAAPALTDGPPYGNVPNRFVAEASDLVRRAREAVSAFRQRWDEIARAVWDQFIREVAVRGNGTKDIWDRQVNNFWELSWAVGSAEDDPLARRKNWRTSPATVEPGDHCSMMGQWQELSGFIRSRNQERDRQCRFWKAVRDGSKVGELDLEEDERLCAIALIKRLFPRVASQALGQELKAENWPSTPYLAAIPWLRKVGKEGGELLDAARHYANNVVQVAEQPQGERYTRIKSLIELRKKGDTGDLFRLDGNFFHQRALRNESVTPLKDEAARQDLLNELKTIQQKSGAAASSFYALLLMDGDSMGELLNWARKDRKEQDVTQALGHFAGEVSSIVDDHDGIVVYAGGDDFLALLPHDRALRCASALRDEYPNSFKSCGDLAARATLSGALLYCDYHLPLRTVLQSAHRLLDEIAKDATGRDSLVIGVWKGSGLSAQWATPWEHLRRGDSNLLDQLAAKLRAQEGGKEGDKSRATFSSSFLYRLRELFASLTDDRLEEPGSFGTLAKDIELERLLLAEYLQGLSHRLTQEEAERQRAKAEENIRLLLNVCFRVERREGKVVIHNGTVGFDGVRLAHFLASMGKEDES